MNKDIYRLNVRFDLHNAEEAEAVAFCTVCLKPTANHETSSS